MMCGVKASERLRGSSGQTSCFNQTTLYVFATSNLTAGAAIGATGATGGTRLEPPHMVTSGVWNRYNHSNQQRAETHRVTAETSALTRILLHLSLMAPTVTFIYTTHAHVCAAQDSLRPPRRTLRPLLSQWACCSEQLLLLGFLLLCVKRLDSLLSSSSKMCWFVRRAALQGGGHQNTVRWYNYSSPRAGVYVGGPVGTVPTLLRGAGQRWTQLNWGLVSDKLFGGGNVKSSAENLIAGSVSRLQHSLLKTGIFLLTVRRQPITQSSAGGIKPAPSSAEQLKVHWSVGFRSSSIGGSSQIQQIHK